MVGALKRLAAIPLRWIGVGNRPAIGISFDDRFVVAASVDAGSRQVLAATVVELDPRTVMSGVVERPIELAEAVRSVLSSLPAPAGAVAAACLPRGLDHRGVAWPETDGADDTGAVETVIEAARSVGVEVRTVVPLAVVAGRLGALAAASGSHGGLRQAPVSVVIRSGWLSSVVRTGSRYVESRTERSDDFRSPPDVRWGVDSERAGSEVDPFHWPRGLRDRRRVALLAAGAAMLV